MVLTPFYILYQRCCVAIKLRTKARYVSTTWPAEPEQDSEKHNMYSREKYGLTGRCTHITPYYPIFIKLHSKQHDCKEDQLHQMATVIRNNHDIPTSVTSSWQPVLCGPS